MWLLWRATRSKRICHSRRLSSLDGDDRESPLAKENLGDEPRFFFVLGVPPTGSGYTRFAHGTLLTQVSALAGNYP